MKNFTNSVACLFLAAVITQGAWAASKNNTTPSTTSSGRGGAYVGAALDNTFVGSSTNPGLTAVFLSGERSATQVYLGIPTIKGTFYLGGGINYKYSVAGDNTRGLHIGIGAGLGAMPIGAGRTFYVNIEPLVGVHFQPVENVQINFDSGLTFQIQTEGAQNLDLILGGNSLLLGFSVAFAI